jgi:hypothetical protein
VTSPPNNYFRVTSRPPPTIEGDRFKIQISKSMVYPFYDRDDRDAFRAFREAESQQLRWGVHRAVLCVWRRIPDSSRIVRCPIIGVSPEGLS